MDLREEFAVVRGEPVAMLPSAAEIPCLETADEICLCRHPVVSVLMITYNHEDLIHRAIESVVSQVADFEFELLIGEDCSKDKTRTICFEYQKRHPDKIRVFWSEKNVGVCENIKRLMFRTRGEFTAICEGDDYWIDPHKLQKQVAVFRSNPSVGICFGGGRIYHQRTDAWRKWNETRSFMPGFVPSEKFFHYHLLGYSPLASPQGDAIFLLTASVMLRKSVVEEARARYPILDWKLALCDTPLWLAVGSLADAYYLPDELSVYYQYAGGAMGTNWIRVARDAILARMYYFVMKTNGTVADMPSAFREKAALFMMTTVFGEESRTGSLSYLKGCRRLPRFSGLYGSVRMLPLRVVMALPLTKRFQVRILRFVYAVLGRFPTCSSTLRMMYQNFDRGRADV